MRTSLLAPAMALILASCRGGSGGGTPPPPLAFTSAQTASLAENTTAAYQASANNPNGGALVFSIEGGADAARFTITAAGALSFVEAPDHDLPGDADGDNVYAVRLRVADGRAEALQPVNITVTNSREGILVTRIATGLNDPTAIVEINGDSRYMLVAERSGGIYYVATNGSGERFLWRQMSDISTGGERGILGMLPDGALRIGIRLYVAVTATDGAIEIRDLIFYASGFQRERPDEVGLRIAHGGTGVRYGGSLSRCGLAACLLLGDGGDSSKVQDPNSPLGKILRLGLGSHDDPVGIAPSLGNPFVNGGGDPYVFAMGRRNPKGGSSYTVSGSSTFLFGDSGPGAIEELNMFSPGQSNLNFGWPFREGTQDVSGTAPGGLTNPVAEYPHGTGPRQGRSITGGVVYSGTEIPSLRGLYIFADSVSGNIWTLPFASLVAGQTLPASRMARRNEDFAPDAGSINRPVAIVENALREIFILDADGDLFKVAAGT